MFPTPMADLILRGHGAMRRERIATGRAAGHPHQAARCA